MEVRLPLVLLLITIEGVLGERSDYRHTDEETTMAEEHAGRFIGTATVRYYRNSSLASRGGVEGMELGSSKAPSAMVGPTGVGRITIAKGASNDSAPDWA